MSSDAISTVETKGQPGELIRRRCISCDGVQHTLRALDLPLEDETFADSLIAVCQKCGLESAYPIPSNEELARWYSRKEHGVIGTPSLLRKIWRRFRSRSNISGLQRHVSSGTVADVGVGRGRFLIPVQATGKWHVIGTDYSEINVEKLKREGYDARLGTLSDVGIEPGSLDAVWASHVVEHMRDPVAFLREVKTYLKSGGHLFVMVPSKTSLRSKLGLSTWQFVNPPGHLWSFQPETFCPVLENEGFEILSIKNSLLVCELMCVARKK